MDRCSHWIDRLNEAREEIAILEEENRKLRALLKEVECLKDICECGNFSVLVCEGCNAYYYCKNKEEKGV